MSNTHATRAADTFYPPALTSTTGYCQDAAGTVIVAGNNVTAASVTNAAAATLLPFGAGKKGYLTVQNLAGGASAFVAFRRGTAAAPAPSITVATGWEIPAGTEKSWFMDFELVTVIEYITSSSTATLHLYVSSPVE